MPSPLRVVILSPPGYRHACAFQEVAETFYYAIRAAGYPVSIGYNRFVPEATHLVLGSNLASAALAQAIPADSVIYNLEQIHAASTWWREGLKTLVARCETWDYSERNVQTLTQLGIARPAVHVPVGYVPELTRIRPAAQDDIDVLFYGSVDDRRRRVLDALRGRGLNVVQLFGVYGEERDAYIARAKVVLNVHRDEARIFEVARVSYLLANRKAVVSECEPGTALEPGIEAAVQLVPYDGLPAACEALVADPMRRRVLEKRGFEWITARPMARILEPHLRRLAAREAPPPAPVPAQLRLGGFDLPLPGWLCADEDNVAADLPLSAAAPLPVGQPLQSARYGEVVLEPGRFDCIESGDWPARVADLERFLRDCTRLLRPGGVLRVRVPHDLSALAGGHPRYRRAFSERAFSGYADAHIAFGWPEGALEPAGLEFELSSFGATLKEQGVHADVLVRTPRAVDWIVATLTRRGHRPLPGT